VTSRTLQERRYAAQEVHTIVIRRTAQLRLTVVALVALVLVLVPAAVAGKGKGAPAAPTGTIKLVPLSPSTDGLLHYGQQVTFDVYTSATAYPWVLLECTKNGSLVYRHQNGIFPTSLMQVFTLGLTPAWTGGAADCTAYLQKRDSRRNTTLATLNFHVDA
jgi:hypothetical protein